MLRKLMQAVVLGLIFLGEPRSAVAIVESEPRELELADREAYDQIMATPVSKEFFGDTGKVYARRWSWLNDKFIIARVENTDCAGKEYCPTAFISVRDQGSKIIGFGSLPSRVRFGDQTTDLCRPCGTFHAVSFVDSADRETVVGFSRNYLFVVGNSE